MHLFWIDMVFQLTGLRQCAERLRLREVGGVPLPVTLVFEFLEEVEAAKPEPGGGVSKEVNVGTLNIVEEQYPITRSK